MKWIILELILILLISCAPFTDSPFSDQLLNPLRNLNQSSLEKLSDIEGDGKIRIAIFTDSHQNYEDLDKVIYEINRTENLDFVVNLGDFTNSAYNLEYDQFLDFCEYIRTAFFTVIGNHDAIGAGPSLFRKAFGASNFWFESPSRRYIFFHSANLEDPDGFDPSWLKNAVETSSKKVFIFSHVSLRDPERFHGEVAAIFDSIIQNNKTQLLVNGHEHVYALTTEHATVRLQAPRVENGQWLLIEIQNLQLSIERKGVGETVWETLKN